MPRPIYPSEKRQPYPLNVGKMRLRIVQDTFQARKHLLLLPVIEPRFLGSVDNFIPDRVKKKTRAYRLHYAETDALKYLYTGRRESIHRIKVLDIKILYAPSLLSDGPLLSIKVWANDRF